MPLQNAKAAVNRSCNYICFASSVDVCLYPCCLLERQRQISRCQLHMLLVSKTMVPWIISAKKKVLQASTVTGHAFKTTSQGEVTRQHQNRAPPMPLILGDLTKRRSLWPKLAANFSASKKPINVSVILIGGFLNEPCLFSGRKMR